MNVAEKVIAVLAEVSNVAPEEISLESRFDELSVDSLALATLIFELEEAYELDIPDDATRDLHPVRDVVEGLQRLLEQGRNEADETAAAP